MNYRANGSRFPFIMSYFSGMELSSPIFMKEEYYANKGIGKGTVRIHKRMA